MIILALAAAQGPVRAGTLSPEEEAAGRKLYLSKCAKCHKLYEPAKYSDAQWSKWEQKMNKKAKLTPEQQQLLWQFVEEKLRAPKRNQTSSISKAP